MTKQNSKIQLHKYLVSQQGNPELKLDKITVKYCNQGNDFVDYIYNYTSFSGVIYGKGVYFGVTAHLSNRYTTENLGRRNMYLCRVLVGSYTKGSEDVVVPPYKDEATKTRYDSVVDKLQNPSVFAVFQDAVAYPEYLITYEMDDEYEIA